MARLHQWLFCKYLIAYSPCVQYTPFKMVCQCASEFTFNHKNFSEKVEIGVYACGYLFAVGRDHKDILKICLPPKFRGGEK